MADIVERFNEVPFNDLHPTVTGGKRKFRGVDLPAWGGSDGLESKHVRCKQCGFIVNKFRNPVGSGWGNIETEIQQTTVTYDSSTTHYDSSDVAYDGIDYIDTVGNAGCPFCGASEYE